MTYHIVARDGARSRLVGEYATPAEVRTAIDWLLAGDRPTDIAVNGVHVVDHLGERYSWCVRHETLEPLGRECWAP